MLATEELGSILEDFVMWLAPMLEQGRFGSLEGETIIDPSQRAWFNIEPVKFESLCSG